MQWLTELFKHITISRSLTGACFMTSGYMLFTSKYLPSGSIQILDSWFWVVKLCFAFSTFILLIWYVPKLFQTLKALFQASTRFDRLSKEEIRFLRFCGKLDNHTTDISEIAKRNQDISKIELLVTSRSLIKKGYLENVAYNDYLVNLTEKGCKYILKEHRDVLA